MKNIGKLIMCAFLGCAASIMLFSESQAAIGTGRLTLLPELALQETYRSNIYQTESDKKSDYITTITPGLGLKYKFGRSSFDLNYRVGFLNFARYSSNNYQDHRANGLLNLVTSGGLQLTLGNNFTKSTLERTGVITRQRPYHFNTFNAAAGYGFADRWKVEAKYVRDDQAFSSSLDRASEYTNSLYGMSLYYRFLPRVSGLIEYDYAVKSFNSSSRISDHKDHLAYLGLAFDPAGKLKGSAKAGQVLFLL